MLTIGISTKTLTTASIVIKREVTSPKSICSPVSNAPVSHQNRWSTEHSSAKGSCRAPYRCTGTVDCPLYTAPATTTVPGGSVDGSMTIPAGVSTMLFNGEVPPNGFMVQSIGGSACWVNDNGPARGPANGIVAAGFQVISAGGGTSLFVRYTSGI